MSYHRQLLEICEGEMRAGKADQVAVRLKELNTAQIPREDRLAFANLCRRASLTELGLRILAPIVRSERASETPTGAEQAEYAVLLMRNGSAHEALRLLQKISPEDVPEVTMFRGFCHIVRWEYNSAIVELENYLRAPVSAYSAFIARVNLASSLICAGRLQDAAELLEANIREAKVNSYNRLLANSLEMRAQVHLHNENFAAARKDLDEAEAILGLEKSSDQLFILKWRAILNGIESKSTAPILAFKEEALRRQHWESVRECDFFTLKVSFDQKLFSNLLFGTPFPSYRERVCRMLNQTCEQSELVLGSPAAPVLDLALGTLDGRDLMNPGKKVQQLLTILLRDLYKPAPLGLLFAELFPGEYFDVHSSVNRVHQLLWRVRSWLKQNDLPLKIEEASNTYRLVITGDLAIRVSLENKPVDTMSVQWNRLETLFRTQTEFKSHEAIARLNISESSFRRLAVWAMDKKLLQRNGRGPATQYSFAAAPSKAA